MRFTIKTTLVGVLALLVAALAVEGLLALNRIRLVNASTVDISRNWLPSIRALDDMKYTLTRLRLVDARFVVASEPPADLAAVAEARVEAVKASMRIYEPLVSSAEEGDLWTEIRRNIEAYHRDRARLQAAAHAGDKAALNATFASSRQTFEAALTMIDKDAALNNRGSDAAVATAAENFESAVFLTSLTLAVATAMGVGGVLYVLFGVGRPIDRIVRAMQAISAGRIDTAIPYARARNEIGDIAASLATFRDSIAETERLRSAQQGQDAAAAGRRRAESRAMADGFEQAVGSIVGMVSASATELQATAGTMTATATETATQSTTVAAAAEEAASNVNTVAAAAEELGVSVQEIGRQVSGSADLARRAVAEADRTGALVQDLSGGVAQIGNVVSLISSIAGQTNLLALNATIEAARAGDAGRGFAVVAAEVKELANQTARATDEISGQIARIQASTDQAVQAIGAITTRIREIDTSATAIAAAVEEQGAATQEIVRNVSQASTGTSAVTRTIAGVAQASEETGAAASQVLSSASELSRQSEHLGAEVARFLASVRAA